MEQSERTKISMSESNSEMLQKKAVRIAKTEGLKAGVPAQWAAFLNVYFDGMIGIGMEFTEEIKSRIYDGLIDFSDPKKGFVGNVDDAIADIKNEIYALKIKSKELTTAGNSGLLSVDLKEDFKKDESLKDRYFYELMYNEFDFILENVIKIVVKDNKRTAVNNPKVFIDGVESVDGVRLNIDAFEPHFLFDMLNEDSFSHPTLVLEEIDGDITAFNQIRRKEEGKVYHILNDDLYVIVVNGETIDVSPVAAYSINGKHNRAKGFSSDNDAADTLGQGTAFINNFISFTRAIRLVDGELVYGKRLSIEDFYELAPHMKDVKPDIKSIAARLDKITKEGNDKIASIARSVLFHVYEEEVKEVEGGDVNSLYSIGKSKNLKIVNSFSSALMSKRQEKYIEFKNNSVRATITASLKGNDYLINDSLAMSLTTRGYTKKGIAAKIDVGPNNSITLYQTIDKGKGASINLEDITDVETAIQYMEYLGLAPLAKSLHEYTLNSLPTKKAADAKFMLYFDAIIKTAAGNIRAIRGKRRYTGKRQSSNFSKHNDFRRITPVAIIKDIRDIEFLIGMFSPDVMGNINVAGSSRSAAGLPGRNGYINNQIESYDKAFDNSDLSMTSNPFLKGSEIGKATYEGYFIKTPMTMGQETMGISDWTRGMRMNFEMLVGFVMYPGKEAALGSRFLVQPLGYSDKSNPHLMDVSLDEFNIFKSGADANEQMEDLYINYNIKKNRDLQKIMIKELGTFVGGSFQKISKAIRAQGDYTYTTTDSKGKDVEVTVTVQERIDSLLELRENILHKKYLAAENDMTRGLNELLEVIRIDQDWIKFSDSKLEYKADVISLSGGSHIYLKPHLGVRAEKFVKEGKALLDAKFQKFLDLLKADGVDTTKLYEVY